MIRLDTIGEVHAFLRDYATAEHHAATPPPMTEAEIAEIEQAFADAPPAADWADADADDIFGDDMTGMFGECDADSPDGF